MSSETIQVPWDELSRSVYGDVRASARSSQHQHRQEHHPADAEIRSALEHRDEARIRVLNALERAGATPLTIRQVQEAMDRRAVTVEPDEFASYRQSWQSRNSRDFGGDTARFSRYSETQTQFASVRPGDNEKAGLGCNLEKTATGTHVLAAVKPGGACADHSIQVGSTLLSVDGVPVRGMSLEEVRQLTMGLVGSHVCIRYRPPGVHAEYPPLEKVLTRQPASFVRSAGYQTQNSHMSHFPGSIL